MDSPSGHRRHHSAGLLRSLNQTGSPEKVKNRVILSSAYSRKRPGSESDILERPSESSLHHQDSIMLGYHHRPGMINPAGNSRQVKPVYVWSQVEVQKWLRRHAPKAYEKYSSTITEHEITGRALIALNDAKLTRMGIDNAEMRNEMISEILKLRLKSYMQCFKSLQDARMFEKS